MSLIKNSYYNIVGFAIPTLIAIPCLGILSRWLNIEHFGVFILSFAVLGYASIFDGGLSRAVTREIAINRDNELQKIKILGTANFLIIIFSFLSAVALYLNSYSIAKFLNISDGGFGEVVSSLKLLSLAIPFYLINIVWVGYLEGVENFYIVNIQKIIGNTSILAFPVIFCLFEKSLFYAILGILLGRFFSWLLTLYFVYDVLIKARINFNKIVAKRFFKFGGWITVSNIISPIMVYMDKFIVSNILGASKLAIYSAPAEGVSRLVNIPIAITKALFPKISGASSIEEQKRLETTSYIIIAILCAPIVLIVFIYSGEIMTLWMGEKYGISTDLILKIFIIGFYFNSLAQVPYTILQSKGFSRTTAFIHLFEIIPYLIAVYYATKNYGIIGAAIVWSLRLFVDFLLLIVASFKVRNVKLVKD